MKRISTCKVWGWEASSWSGGGWGGRRPRRGEPGTKHPGIGQCMQIFCWPISKLNENLKKLKNVFSLFVIIAQCICNEGRAMTKKRRIWNQKSWNLIFWYHCFIKIILFWANPFCFHICSNRPRFSFWAWFPLSPGAAPSCRQGGRLQRGHR